MPRRKGRRLKKNAGDAVLAGIMLIHMFIGKNIINCYILILSYVIFTMLLNYVSAGTLVLFKILFTEPI